MGTLSLGLLLGMLANFDHAFVVTFHAIYAVAGFGKHELVDAVLADLALEAVGVIRVVAGHDGLVKNGLLADVARVRAVGAYRGTIGEQEEVCVCGDLVSTLCTFEAVDMEKGLAGERDVRGRESERNMKAYLR